jgi:hypothetical protein
MYISRSWEGQYFLVRILLVGIYYVQENWRGFLFRPWYGSTSNMYVQYVLTKTHCKKLTRKLIADSSSSINVVLSSRDLFRRHSIEVWGPSRAKQTRKYRTLISWQRLNLKIRSHKLTTTWLTLKTLLLGFVPQLGVSELLATRTRARHSHYLFCRYIVYIYSRVRSFLKHNISIS